MAVGGFERGTAATADTDRVLATVCEVLTPFAPEGGGPADETFAPQRAIAEFGGSSVQMLQIHAHLEAAFGIQIPTTALFDYPTVGELVAYLRGCV
jgi:acyl carrier protein